MLILKEEKIQIVKTTKSELHSTMEEEEEEEEYLKNWRSG